MSVVRPIFGRGGGKGSPQQQPVARAPVEAPNSLQSRSIARFLDLWCEGPIHGLVNEDESIFFDDTPLKNSDGTFNFKGVAWDTRYGYPFGIQKYMAGFPSSRSTVGLGGGSGLEVTQSTGGVVHTISNAEADAAIVKISTPALYSQNQSNGDVNGYRAPFGIWVKANGGSFVQTHDVSFEGKCTSTYQRDYRVALPPGGAPWQIKVTRGLPDHTNQFIKDAIYFTSVTEVVDAKLSHPNVAYCGVQIDTAQFSGRGPARSYDVKGLLISIPSNYDPVTRNYTGPWDGTFTQAWSDNPAWCFYDLLLNTRYGLGMDPSAVNPWKWDLYTIAQYCDAVDEDGQFVGIDDGKGGKEPRYTCNLLLNSRQEAYAVINTMASIFRGMPFWSSGAVRVTADMPKAPSAIFTNSNVLGGEFKYEGTSLKARHTVAKIIWNDPDDAYRPAVEYVDDPEGVALYGSRQIDIVAYGCTSRGQAIRAGKWVLDTERTATEAIHFRSGLELADKFPGEIISVVDENYAQQVFGGRAVAASPTSITLDAPYTVLAAYSHKLKIMLPNGDMEERTLSNDAGETTELTWVTPLSDTPLPGAVWAVTSFALEARQFLIVSNSEVGPATFEVMGVFYDPAKFDRVEKDIVVPPPPYNVTPTGPIREPTGPSSMIRLYQVGSAIRAAVILSWERADDARVYGYEVQVRAPGETDYVYVGDTSMTSIEYQDSVEGLYDFRVRSKSLNGKTSAWLEAEGINLTSAVPPSDVTGLAEVYDPDGLAIKWDAVPDFNVDYYEVRHGTTWEDGTPVGKPRELRYTEKGVAAGTQRYWVAAVSKPQGIYSVNPVSVDVEVAAPSTPSVSAALDADLYRLTWTASVSNFQVDHYEIREGADWETGALVSTVKGTTYSAPVNWSGDRLFWVSAVDKAENVGAAGSTSLTVASPGAVQLNAQVIDNNVLLRWTDALSPLPVDHYLVKKGDTCVDGVSIGGKSGTFTSVFETAAGTYTYWVAAVDSAGNEGTPVSVVAVVNQPPDYILRVEWESDFSGTLTNMTVAEGVLYGPADTTETWATHFTDNGWDQPSDQITAGYVDWLDPAPGTASYVEVFDYGTTVAATLITASVNKLDVSGAVGMTITMETSLDGSSWSTLGTGAQQFAVDFRYLRLTLDFTSSGAVCAISSLAVKLSSKLKSDSGVVTANSGDSGGTTVTFNEAFVSVSSITLTPSGTSVRTAVYDFVSTPYPTDFKVLLFDGSGNRTSGEVSWQARGY